MATTTPPSPARRPRRLLVGLAVVLVVGTGAALSIAHDRHHQIAVNGMVVIDAAGEQAGTSCTPADGYDDIPGAQVVVTDDAGKTLAVGQLEAGTGDGVSCDYLFSLRVPGGRGPYQVTVGGRGSLTYTESQLRSPLELSLR